MEEKRSRDRRSGSDRRISLTDYRYNENLRILKVKIIMSTKQIYVGEFQTHELKGGLSDALDNENFITLTDARIDDFLKLFRIVLNKHSLLLEEISSRKFLGKTKLLHKAEILLLHLDLFAN
jgi:hypothetical protein